MPTEAINCPEPPSASNPQLQRVPPIISDEVKALIESNKEGFLETHWDYTYISIQNMLSREKVRLYIYRLI